MKVILIEDIKGTGKKGDLVEVSDGFARNFLLRLNKAKVATKTEISNYKQQQDSAEYHEEQKFEKAKERFEKINGKSITIKAKKGDKNKLFGSITTKTIADRVSKEFFEIDKKDIKLNTQIKEIGTYTADIKLYNELTATLSLEIVSEKK